MEHNKTMTDYLKLSSKTFYDFHISEINKYKNKNDKVLHIVNKDIEFEGLGLNEEVLEVSINEEINLITNKKKLDSYDLIIVTDIFDITKDVMKMILLLERLCAGNGKILFSNLNSRWHFVFNFFEFLRLKKQSPKRNKISPKKIINVAKGGNLELIKTYTRLYFPFHLFGLGVVINSSLEILFARFSFGMKSYSLFRKSNLKPSELSKTLIIPAKNEEGNLDELVERININHKDLQIIFCIGESKDNTYEKALEITKKYKDISFKLFTQISKGKGGGVFESFQYVENDIVAILDSDLSVDPEEMTSVFKILEDGTADFVNCTRLVYKMEKGAMRALNNMMNAFFPLVISSYGNIRLTDTLCGTKVFSKKLVDKIILWNKIQKNVDPFGDFDMIFSAIYYGEKIVEYPVYYRSRRYGQTQIHRFRDGARLLYYLLIAVKNINVSKR